jgi:putative transposase
MTRLRMAKMTLFEKKYRVESARHPVWNYRDNAYYFVTICTKNRTCSLGAIRHGIVGLSLQGSIAY